MTLSSLKQRMARTLRWSERYTKTDMIYLTRGGTWLSINQGSQTLLGLLSALAFANLMEPYMYGTYKYVLSIVELIGIIGLSGMGITVTRQVARGHYSILTQAIRQTLLIGSIGTLLSICIGIFYLLRGDLAIGGAILVGGIFTPLMQAMMLPQAFFDGLRSFREKVIWSIGTAVLSTLATIGVLLTLPWIPILIATPMLTSISMGFLAYQSVQRRYPASSQKTTPPLLTYALHQSAISSLATIATKLETLFLFQLLGPISVAIYNFAAGMPNQFSFISKALKTLAVPRFSQQTLHGIAKALPWRMGLFFIGMLLLVGVYILAAPYLFALLFPKYMESIWYSQIISLTLLFAPLSLFVEALAIHGHHRELYINQIILFVGRVTSLLILVPILGILGVIFSIFIARFLSLGYMAYCIVRMRNPLAGSTTSLLP